MVRCLLALAAGLVLLAGCTGAPAKPPAARTLAHRLSCAIEGPGLRFAAYDVRQDDDLAGGTPVCLGGEVYTFPSAKAQADWLHQVQVSNSGQSPAYSYLVDGNLWAVIPGNPSADRSVIRTLGGKEVTF